MVGILLAWSLKMVRGDAGETIGVANDCVEERGESVDGREKELVALFAGEEADDVPVEKDLLVPGNAGDEVVRHVAGLSPGATADEHAPESDPEAPCSADVVEGHEIVFGVLAEPIKEEADVGQQQEDNDGKKQSEVPEEHCEIAESVGGGEGERKGGGAIE